jgi:hypothetical protein
MVSEEPRRGRLLMLGLLLMAGKCVVKSLRAAGSMSYCYPWPEKRPQPGPAPREPSLRVAERLTWIGLQWHLDRQEPRPRSK